MHSLNYLSLKQNIAAWQIARFVTGSIHEEMIGNMMEIIPLYALRMTLTASRASMLAQTVKNLLAMKEMRVRSLGVEDPVEKGMATNSSILAWRIP